MDREGPPVAVVFDTNVIAYALLGVEEFREEALEAITRATEVWAPESLKAEMVNTAWQWVRFADAPLETGLEVLRDTEIVVTDFVSSSSLWESALELAVARQHPAYDTLFVALAARRGSKVVTYDQEVISRFPEWALSVSDYLAARRAR